MDAWYGALYGKGGGMVRLRGGCMVRYGWVHGSAVGVDAWYGAWYGEGGGMVRL